LYPNFAGDALPSWVCASRVTLVGDAAHTHGGAFAAGGSLALDDSYALALAFRHIFSSSSARTAATGKVPFTAANIGKGLALYDRTRRPHTARLLKIVHAQVSTKRPTALLATSAEKEKNADAALIERMRNRPDTEWLAEHDVERAFRGVVEAVEGSNEIVLDERRTPSADSGRGMQRPLAVNLKASKL
jgi:salicylate hydroxylase